MYEYVWEKRWGVRPSVFTNPVRDPLEVGDKPGQSVCQDAVDILNACVSEWLSECANESHVGASPDLVLGGELLHVGAETPEARQEVVDHHLLRNDWDTRGVKDWIEKLMNECFPVNRMEVTMQSDVGVYLKM